MSFSKKKKEI